MGPLLTRGPSSDTFIIQIPTEGQGKAAGLRFEVLQPGLGLAQRSQGTSTGPFHGAHVVTRNGPQWNFLYPTPLKSHT